MSRTVISARSAQQRPSLTGRPAWMALAEHQRTIASLHLRQLFADDPRRGWGEPGTNEPALAHDSSTHALIRRYRRLRETRA